MKSYEYPQVRPPTLMPPQPPVDARFSWMTADQDDGGVARRQTRLQVSRQGSNLRDLPQEQVEEDDMEPQAYSNGAVPYQREDLVVTQQQNIPAPQYQAHQGAYPAQPYLNTHISIPQPQSPPPQHPIPPLPQPPEPVKQPTLPEDDRTGPIAPDANPLTPTSPKHPQRPSTNMAIVPPSPADYAQFSPNPFTPSPQAIKGGSWQHSFCSCAETSICITGLFCPCIIYGKTQYRLGLRDEKKDPTNMLGYTAVNGSCVAFGVLCGINGILAAIQHTRLRKRYNMNGEAGNVAGDCLKGLCCCCCVVAQDEKEVKFREEQARKPAGSSAKKEGYVAPTSMTFSPPPR